MRSTALFPLLLLITAQGASAYIGPGIGLGLIGSTFGVVWALLAAVLMVLLWPLRKLWLKLKRRSPASPLEAAGEPAATGAVVPSAPPPPITP